MPVITYEGSKMSKEQRQKLIEGFTEVAANVLPHISKESFYVFINEYDSDRIGVGGKFLEDFLKSKK